MKTEDIDKTRTSPWVPTTDKLALSVLGKLGEETGELSSIIFRTIIQGGLNEADPETGQLNRDALLDEIADVCGLCELVMNHFGLDWEAMLRRSIKKRRMKEDWVQQLRDAGHG